jgi:hypothetical protein
MENMDRLLCHFLGNVKLDAETLQNLADSVEVKKARDTHAPNEEEGALLEDEDNLETCSNSSDRVKVDEVSFQPLENNATRKSTDVLPYELKLTHGRLFGRVLTLELFHAHKKLDRADGPSPYGMFTSCRIGTSHY